MTTLLEELTKVPVRPKKRPPAPPRPKPSRVSPTAVYVRAIPGLPATEDLYLLAALEAAALQEPNLCFRYGSEHAEIVTLARSAWFLEEVKHLDGALAWANWHGPAIALALPEPDPDEALTAEQALYDSWHAAETGQIQRQQAAVNEAGVKDLVLPLPEYRFQPGWHKTNGYVWALGDYLGAPLAVPGLPLQPYGTLPRALEKEYLRQFQKAGLTRRGFLVYDLEHEVSPFALLGAMGGSFGAIQWVSLAEVADLLETSTQAVPLAALIALCGHPNAWFAIGPQGKLLTAAWAAKLPNMLELYTGLNPAWDGVQGANALRVHREQFPEGELAPAMASAAELLVHRAQ